MNDKTKQEPVKRKSLVKRIFKSLMWTVAVFILLVVILLGCVVWILAPERLTPIVEQYANEYLDARVDVGRVELTFWKTFPQLRVDVDTLSIVSDQFDGLSDEMRSLLPENSDTVMSLSHFHGGINVMSLIAGKIGVYDVELRQPMINIVQYNDSINNYSIIPPSEPDTTSSQGMSIPEISLDKFIIADALPIRYFSLNDSIDASITLGTTYVDGNDAPKYELAVNGDARAMLLPIVSETDIPIGINGEISWSPAKPAAVALTDFTIDIAELHSIINTSVDFTDKPVVNSFSLLIKQLPVAAVISHLPQETRKQLAMLETDLTVSAGATLTQPYVLTGAVLPSMELSFDVHPGYFRLGKYHKPMKMSSSIVAHVVGDNLNKSSINVKSLIFDGENVDANINGTFQSLLSDPKINANFDGSISFDHLPKALLTKIPGKISGRLTANTSINLRKSYLTRKKFHKARLKGSATLHDFTFIDSATELYTRNTTFRFGTNNSFVTDSSRVDSLLTASIKIDTAMVDYSGTRIVLSDLKAGVGSANIATSIDSTQINPIGATIIAQRVNFNATDSTRLRLRDIKCRASLRRFHQDAKVPELNMSIEARRVNYGDNLNRLNLREGKIDMTAHLRPRRSMSTRMQARYDSISRLHPDLAPDSIFKLARNSSRRNRTSVNKVNDGELMDFALDNSTKDLLRRWNVQGSITAKRGRLFTPYFPLRNRLNDINVTFNTDSLQFRKVKYTVGNSDFLINGKVLNIRRALTSRRGTTPLKVRLNMRSDTIDVNEIAEAVFAGAAFAEKMGEKGVSLSHIENEDSLENALAELQVDDTLMTAIVVPKNVDVSINVNASNVAYSDLMLHRFRGSVLMREGAVNLRRLTAKTDLGSVNMSALYTAPTKKDLSFGFGLKIRDLQLKKVLHMIPAIDTIMPMLNEFEGIIDADIAATTNLDSAMNFVLPSLNAAIKLHGDSLVLLDADTFKFLSKWLMFKDKKRNMIDKMTVEVLVENSTLEMFPFMFDIDRYRLGVMGSNDLAMNYKYHVSVLKSPLPFKFGINVSGNPDDMKIRVGKAKFKEKMVTERVALVDTTRINLLDQIENVFRRGVNNARLGKLKVEHEKVAADIDISADTISRADSLLLIQSGILPESEISGTTKPIDNK